MGSPFKIVASSRDEAEIYIYGDIGDSIFGDSIPANEFIAALNETTASTIYTRINSYGGSVTDGLAIYNALKRHPAKVITTIDGLAASSASLIAMAGDEVSMADNALLMIHAPWSVAIGNALDLRQSADTLDKFAESMASSYAHKTGKPLNEVMALLKDGQDHWYSAEEAIAGGFADYETDSLQAAAIYHGAAAQRFSSFPSRMKFPQKEIVKMHRNRVNQEPIVAASTPAQPPESSHLPDLEAARREAVEAEARRRAEIKADFNKFTVTPAAVALMDKCLDDTDCTAEEARRKIIAYLSDDAEPIQTPNFTAGLDERDKFRAGAIAGILARAGIARDEPGNEMRGFGPLDYARGALEKAGVDVSRMSKYQIANAAVTTSTSDFPLIYEQAFHKILLAAFNTFPYTWPRWCATGDLADFRPHNRYRMGTFSDLPKLQENAEIVHGTLPDAEKESISADEHGLIFTLSHKMIVDDDMGAFNNIARMLGRAAARSIENDVYTLLKSNPAMSDSTALFHANHNNLASTGAVISVDSLGKARTAMRTQMQVGGNDYADIMPRTLLVPVEQGDLARQVLTSEADPDAKNSRVTNPVRGMVEVVDTPRLSGTPWYLMADPADAPVIEVGFVGGAQNPEVMMEEQFNTRGIAYRVVFDYGVAAIEYRGGFKNSGA